MFGIYQRISYPIGEIGWAQVGQEDYLDKVKIERRVINELFNEHPELQLPDELIDLVRLKWCRNAHDFGTYHTFEALVQRDLHDNENHPLRQVFDDWYEKIEDFDFEKEEYDERCRAYYVPPMDLIQNKPDDDPLEHLNAI